MAVMAPVIFRASDGTVWQTDLDVVQRVEARLCKPALPLPPDVPACEQRAADRAMNLAFLRGGIARGWWEDVDEGAMVPVRVARMSDFHEHATVAHLWIRFTRRFPSMKEAKRAGLGVPLTPGTYRHGTWILRVEAG
jgi:hypothetical protein